MKRAYTLIEMIAVLLLVAVLTLTATVALVPIADAFLQVRTNTDAMQKTAFAMARITRELTTVTNVVAGAPTTITYDLLDEQGVPRRRTLDWSGGAGAPLRLAGAVLLDDVAGFELKYYAMPGDTAQSGWGPTCREIEVVLALASVPNVYTLRIRPRNVR